LSLLSSHSRAVMLLHPQAAARNAPQLTREQIREMRRAHDPHFKEREWAEVVDRGNSSPEHGNPLGAHHTHHATFLTACPAYAGRQFVV
jgi:hypothetical protein